jgi:hypothetical protein
MTSQMEKLVLGILGQDIPKTQGIEIQETKLHLQGTTTREISSGRY